MKNTHWNEGTFGATLPTNWEEIADAANAMIDEFAATASDDDLEVFCNNLWEQFCETDSICDIVAQF